MRVLILVVTLTSCYFEEEIPPEGSAACMVSVPTGCPPEAEFCCALLDDEDEPTDQTYCVAEPLLGDWLCVSDTVSPARRYRPISSK